MGGSVKRSLAMAFLECNAAIAKAFGLDDATRPKLNMYCKMPHARHCTPGGENRNRPRM